MKCKGVVIAAILLTALIGIGIVLSAKAELNYSEESGSGLKNQNKSSISLDKPIYTFGETVYLQIDTAIVENELVIKNNRSIYRYLKPDNDVAFVPKYTGDYTALLLDILNKDIAATAFFTINENDTPVIFTDKQSYTLGESVNIYTGSFENSTDYKITIKSNSSAYNLVGSFENPMIFTPTKEGEYAVVLEDMSKNRSSSYFFSVESSFKEPSIKTDKTIYLLGEKVRITTNFARSFHSTLTIFSGRDMYRYLGSVDGVLEFEPKEEGNYSITLEDGSRILASSYFITLKDLGKNISGRAYSDKKEYYQGDLVHFYSEYNISEIKILFGNETFILDSTFGWEFMPNITGKYIVQATIFDGTSAEVEEFEFFVIVKEEGYPYFDLDEEVSLDFNFSEWIKPKRNIMNLIFGSSPVEEVTAYVINHSEDLRFKLGLQKLESDTFRVRIFKNESIEAGIYTLSVTVKANGEYISSSREFRWGVESSRNDNGQRQSNQISTPPINDSENLTKYVKFSFALGEIPNIELDFGSEVQIQRSLLETVLKKTGLNEITSYVEGEENNPNLNLSISNVEFDRFMITINIIAAIEPDVYKLVVLGKYGPNGTEIKKEIWFNWGLENNAAIIERLIKKNEKDAGLGSKTNRLNYTIITDKKEYILGETVIIDSNAQLSEITIKQDDTKYSMNFEPSIAFAPTSEGTYVIEARVKGLDEALTTNFFVSANVSSNLSNKINLSEKTNKRKIIEKTSIRNSKKQKMENFNVEFYDEDGAPIDEIQDAAANVEIKPAKNKISRIRLNNLKIKNQSISIGIDEIPINKINLKLKNRGLSNAFAIDPSELNFTDGTVSAIANGTELWKCKEWNFTEQQCFGAWQKVKDIIPGQEYSFALTLEDPAFAEIFITNAVHLDENRNYIEDIYDFVNSRDQIWKTIPAGHYVRVSFETNLTSDRDIRIYARSGDMGNVEVYEEGKDILIADFGNITEDRRYYSLLTNLLGSQDTFDLKITRGDVEFDYIVDPATSVNMTQPDAGAPGMNLVVQFIGSSFDTSDYVRVNTSDITVGPIIITNASGHVVSTNGKVLSTVFFISDTARTQDVRINFTGTSLPSVFKIYNVTNTRTGNLTGASGTIMLGNGRNGTRTKRGTIVLDSLIIPAGVTAVINTTDLDSSVAGDQGYLPVILIVDGPVNIQGTLNVSGAAGGIQGATTETGGRGGDGGPGGGGGGAGGGDGAASLSGGNGFTGGGGGGNDNGNGAGGLGGNGTGSLGSAGPSNGIGGSGGSSISPSVTGGTGGAGDGSDGAGGGGGTGYYFGTSGTGGADPGTEGIGGLGGGGGSYNADGGGGGFATNGSAAEGGAGALYGNDQLVPLMGGSGGGGGGSSATNGGGGGGGGGAILIFSNGNITISGSVLTTGGAGGDGGNSDGGGGSGGAIILQSYNVTVSGTLSTSGGDSPAGGDGGTGRIRIDGSNSTTLPGTSGSKFSGPSILGVNDSHIWGRANTSSTIQINILGTYANGSFSGSAGATGTFSIAVNYSHGRNYITAIQNTSSGLYSVMGSAGVTTYYFTDSTPPIISSISPQNNSFVTGAVTLSATTNEIANCKYNNTNSSFNFNISGTFFSTTGGTSHSISLGTLSDGSKEYYIKCNDSVGNINTNNNQGITNFTVDNYAPSINYAGGTEYNNTFFNRNWIYVNVSVVEANMSNITFSLYNSSFGVVNQTNYTTAVYSINFTNLNSNMVYYYNVTVRDRVGFSNATQTYKLTLDSTYPSISFAGGTPANNTFFNKNWIYANVSAYDSNEANLTFYLFNSSLDNINTTTLGRGNRSINFTILADGTYYYNVTITDKALSQNRTETRNITLDTALPVIGLVEPQDNSWDTDGIVQFSYTSVDANSAACELWGNFSGQWRYNQTDDLVRDGENLFSELLDLPEGTYIWNVRCNDSAGNIAWNATNFTIKVDKAPPIVGLLTPPNASYDSDGLVEFNYSLSESNEEICQLWGNFSGTWQLNQTDISPRSGTVNNFIDILNLTDGTYIWNVWCNDSIGNSAFNATNFTFYVDLIYPTITFTGGTPDNNSFFNRNWIYVNVSVVEANFRNITFSLYNSSFGIVNQTNYTTATYNINFTNLNQNMVYYYNVTVRDRSGFTNTTQTYKITLDSTYPSISYAGGTAGNNSYFNRNWIYVNVSITETNFNNITFSLYNSSLDIINQTNYTTSTYNINFTSLNQNMVYYYNVTVRDKAGLENSTQTYKLILDSTYPSISYAGGIESNNSYLNRNWIYVNVSFTEDNFANITFSLYNSSFGVVNQTNYTSATYNINFTNLNSNMAYYYNVTVRDRVGFSNTTQTYKITLDSSYPSISYAGGTEANNSYFNRNWIYVNVSVTETNFNNITFSLYNSSFGIINQTNFTSATYNINFTNLNQNMVYYYNVTVRDLVGLTNTTQAYKLTLETNPPVVSLNTPSNGSYDGDGSVQMSYTPTDDYALKNCSLWGNFSGAWRINQTNTSPVSGSQNSFNTVNLTDGRYIWNVQCFDNATNEAWNSTNFTFTVYISPNVTINAPNGTIADHTPTLNISLGESVQALWYNINNGTNITICTSCSGVRITYLHLAEGVYTVNAFANNTLRNTGSDSSQFTIDMNNNHYDSYDDNSSIRDLNNATWNAGNISFTRAENNYQTAGFNDNKSARYETTGGWPQYFLGLANDSGDPNGCTLASIEGSGAYTWTNNGMRINDTNPNEGDSFNSTTWVKYTKSAQRWNCDTTFNPSVDDDLIGCYGHIYVWSSTSQTVNLRWGSDDSGIYWINGQRASWTAQTCRAYADDSETDSISLNQGWNRLLFSGWDNTGGWDIGFRFRNAADSADINLNYTLDEPIWEGITYGNFTIKEINTTYPITKITNITWTESGTDANNIVTVQVSLNNGQNWHNAVNGQELTGLEQGSSLVYRVLFSASEPTTLIVKDINISWSTNPTVTLISPPQDYQIEILDTQNVSFNCSINDSVGLKNLSFYLTNNHNQSFSFNDTCNVLGYSSYCNWTKTLALGNYTWNCFGYNNISRSSWGTERSIGIGYYPPGISGLEIIPNITGSGKIVRIRANVTDTTNLSTVFAYLTDPNSQISSYQMSSVLGNIYEYNYTTWVAGIYSVYIWANDTLGFSSSNSDSPKTFSINNTVSVSIITGKDTYKSNEYVNLSNSTFLSDWWNTSFTYRKKVRFFESNGVARDNTHVLFDVTFESGKENNENGTALVCNNRTVPFDAYATSTSGGWVTALQGLAELNFSASEAKICYLYYDPMVNAVETLPSKTGWTLAEQDYPVSTSCTQAESDVTSPTCFQNFSVINYGDAAGSFGLCGAADYDDNIWNAFCYFKAPTTEVETFGTRSDDSSFMYIDGTFVVDAGDACQGPADQSGAYSITKNRYHKIKVLWNENDGGETARVYYNSSTYAGTGMNLIDTECYPTILDEWEISTTVYSEEESTMLSSIENTGFTNISGYLLMQIQYDNGTVVATQVNDTSTSTLRNLSNGSSLELAPIWNANKWYTDNSEVGTYRVYGALTDPYGIVLENSDGTDISGYYSFALDYMRIGIDSPVNGSIVDATSFWVNITLTYISYPSGGWCGYSLDEAANITMSNDSAAHFYNATTTSVAQHNITFYCNDSEGTINTVSTTFSAQDLTSPVVNLTYPTDNLGGLASTTTFIYNVSDFISNISNCTIYIDAEARGTNTTVQKNRPQNFTVSSLNNGNHDWYVQCYDNSTNRNLGTSVTWSFYVGTDTGSPQIWLHEPADDTSTSNNDVIFTYSVFDWEASDIVNCSLIINNRINQTNSSITPGIAVDNNFTVNNMANALFNWTVNCTDIFGNIGTYTPYYNLTVTQDYDYPVIILIGPVNNFNSTSSSVTFQYNVTDASSNIANCSLIINGTINTTVNNPAENTVNSITVPGFREANYTWRINCTDDSFQANKNGSEIRNFSVRILGDLSVRVETSNTTYQQGTQVNETINITTTVKDQLNNYIDVDLITDIIKGNTSLIWWNSSLKYRKEITFREPSGVARNKTHILFNITLETGKLSNENGTALVCNGTQVPFDGYATATSDSWVTVLEGIAEMNFTAYQNRTCYLYYDPSNSAAETLPVYNTGWILAEQDYPVSTSCTQAESDVTSPTCFQNFSVINYGDAAGSFGLCGAADYDDNIWNAFCYFKAQTTESETFGTRSDDSSFMYIKSTLVVNAGDGCQGPTDQSGSYTITKGRYYPLKVIWNENDGGETARVYYNSTTYAGSGMNLIDTECYPFIGDEWQINGTEGAEHELINRSINETGSDGIYTVNYSTLGLATGWYSAVSLTTSTGYNAATNYTLFQIITDNTAPIVSLISPNNGNVSILSTITFSYNVTDALSGISNCSLIINGTVNMTNSTITEGAALNFTLTLANGDYTWNVNCTDNSANHNKGTATARTLTMSLDDDAPAVNLITPVNWWNDTDGNITFFFNFSDQYTTTADCELYINGSLNQTKYNLQRNTVQNFTINSTFAEGNYSWFVNCTDDSLARNSNISLTRNFTVAYDLNAPSLILIAPDNPYQSTTGNVSFLFNITDVMSGIANCSLIFNGTVNRTNSSVNEDITQNFTLYNIGVGTYLWNITCADSSDYHWVNISETRTLVVATDVQGPNVSLEDPIADAQITTNTVLFKYNVTDFASGISNCSLIINGTRNMTNSSVSEGISQNFTVYLADGDYNWRVNCTDNSANYNIGTSELRYLYIGMDEVPPVVTLESPPNNDYNDTDGNITFLYNVYDYASGIANCSMILDGNINITNTTRIYESTSGQNFTIAGISDGYHSWSINCTDTASPANTGNSSTWYFNVTIDLAGPNIRLIYPGNLSTDTNGNVLFGYNATDEIAGIKNCSLIINGAVNMTNSTVTEGVPQTFSVSGLANGLYNWSVNCTDNSDNYNRASSESWIVNVTIDNIGPRVYLELPANNTLDTNGVRTFYYNVTDDISNISSCSLLFNGIAQLTNYTIQEEVSQSFTKTGITTGQYNWSVNCTDGSDNHNINGSEKRNLTVLLDSAAPVISLEYPYNNTQHLSNNVVFRYNVSDTFSIANCSLIINGTVNQSNSTITRNQSMNFSVSNIPSGDYLWNVNCTDATEDYWTGSSAVFFVRVGADTDPPEVYLESPSSGFTSLTGIVNFYYNATDFGSTIANCSLILNGRINTTNSTVQESQSQRFYLSGMANGNYNWSVNCTDNATAHNVGNSSTRLLVVGADVTPPEIHLISPVNGTYTEDTSFVFKYNISDTTSTITNCSLVINGQINQTDDTITNNAAVQQNFTLSYLGVGSYLWGVNCTDNATAPNNGGSEVYNLSVVVFDPLVVSVGSNKTSLEQGEIAYFDVNTTDKNGNRINATLYFDIIKGNATAAWWNSSWRYRIPVTINTTIVNRDYKLIEHSVNFTNSLFSELGITNESFDQNSVRVVEWLNNYSVEIPSQFERYESYNSASNAVGDVVWVMDTAGANTLKQYYIYFETNVSSKQAANYSTRPTFTFSGSSKGINYSGTSTSADYATLSYQGESFILQFSDGSTIPNQEYINKQGAGSIWNITINGSAITNSKSSIVPFSVLSNHYLTTNETVIITVGDVVSKVRIKGNVSNNGAADAELNYTIWFTGSEVKIKSSLYVDFGQSDGSPVVRYQNIWFAYQLDNSTDWGSYITHSVSESFSLRHVYRSYNPTFGGYIDQFNPSSWYAENGSLGSINMHLESFDVNSVTKPRGIVTFDDGYSATWAPESDGVGFNHNNSDDSIAAGDNYSVKVWMTFARNSTSGMAQYLANDTSSPMNISQGIGERLMQHNSTNTIPYGNKSFSWSTYGQPTGWYSAAGQANKTYLKYGFDYLFFEITTDITVPIVNISTPEGWVNYTNITFNFYVSDNNPTIPNCTLFINNQINITKTSLITNNAWNTIISNIQPEGTYNWTVNCSDAAGNVGNSSTKTIYVDITKPTVNLTTPINNSNTTSSTVNFNFTAIDNMDINISCYVLVNNTIRGYTNATNGTISTITVNDMTHGVYLWNVTCTDEAGNYNTSETRTITVNLLGTSIDLLYPKAPTNWVNGQNVNFSYRPSSISPIQNCSIFIDGIFNMTNSSISNGGTNYFRIIGIPEGRHNWSVNCTDSSLRTSNSTTETFYIDLTKPSIYLNYPGLNAQINDSTVNFNFTVIDNLDLTLDCNITLDGRVNNTSPISADNGTPEIYPISGIGDGTHKWNVTCIDGAANVNTSLTRNFTISAPPSVSQVSPPVGGWDNDGNITFIYYVSDNTGLANCSLIINGNFNKTNQTTIINNANNNITLNNIPEGTYNWSINCTDTYGNKGNSSTRLFYVDTGYPRVNLTWPINGGTVSSTTIGFNFTVLDNMDTQLQCNLTLDGIIRNPTPISADNGTNTTYTVSSVGDGPHTWNVTCWDEATNKNTSSTWSFNSLVPPVIYLLNPTDGQWNQSRNITFYYNLTDLSGIANCSLVFNGVKNLTNTSRVNVNQINNFTLYNISEGEHSWTINCTDATGLEGTANLRTLYIDNTPTSINLNYPSPEQSINTSTVIFNFTAYDNVDSILDCNFTLDGRVNNTQTISANNGTPKNYTITGIIDGRHYWNVTCWDNATNINTSLTRNFSVGEPPNVRLINPANLGWLNYNSNVLFIYNASDNVGVTNCTFILNGAVNQTNSSIRNGSLNNFTLPSISDGAHYWSINCSDGAGLVSSSEIWTIYIDTSPPSAYILTLNNSNFSDSTPEIQFNITDNFSPAMNYTFFINYATRNTNGTANKDELSYANLTTLADGYYNITLRATDIAGNSQNSSAIRILIDTTPPTITIQNPSTDEVLGYTIYLQTQINDSGVGLLNASYKLFNTSLFYYQNGSLNSTDNFDAVWDSRNFINNESDTNYVYFNVTAGDGLGNNQTVSVRFIVDNKNPSIDFNYPSGNYIRQDFNLNILVQNHHLNASKYNITNSSGYLKDSNVNNSIGQASFTWTDLINISNTTKYPEGTYNITVYANDSVGNNRTSYTYFIIDRTAPNISLEAPINGYNSSTNSIIFNFTAIDNFDINLTCNITINGTVRDASFNAQNGTKTNRTISGLMEGTQPWNATCWDDAGNANTSSTRSFTVDTSAPIISLVSPENGHWNNTGNITFTYIPNDIYTNIMNCSLIINGAINKTNFTITENGQNNFTLLNIGQGIYNWTINCTDTVGNVGTNTSIRNFYVDWTPPTVNITTTNRTWFNDPTPEIFFNITDNIDSLLNYTFYINYIRDINGTTASAAINSNNLSSLQNGTYIVILEGWDDVNSHVNSTPITIYIDTVNPNVTLLAPANNSNTTQDVQFNFTATDNMDVNLSCNLTIDNIVNLSGVGVGNGTNISITVLNIPNGYHNWSVICIDNASNIQASQIWYFNVTPPDLSIVWTEIIFNNTSPTEGDNITINATIRNIGYSDAQNVLVQFYNGNPDSGGLQIDGNRTVNVQFGSYVVVNTTWTATLGTHYIFVRIDTFNSIAELNENNNRANRSITISSWAIAYGNVSGYLIIENLINKSVFMWNVTDYTSGNIYIIDTDSNVAWSNLSAIGVKTNGQNTSNDFEEIDTVLLSTNYSDSVNRTYSFNGSPVSTSTFVAFSKQILNVPVVNSTNTSNFQTGILWDASDDSNGEYNGTEDLVFVTRINQNMQGAYGLYDFEARVPSELKKYKTPDLYSLTFYVELT